MLKKKAGGGKQSPFTCMVISFKILVPIEDLYCSVSANNTAVDVTCCHTGMQSCEYEVSY